MLDVPALQSMRVMFCTPCYASALTSPYVASLYTLAGDLARLGIANQLELYSESLITRARNMLVGKFIECDCTHLFWIDADIQFTTKAALRLLAADRDVAVGVYRLKQMTEVYPFFPIDDHADEDGFCEVYSGTTGFMCIKRSVIESMMQKYPELNYVPDGPLGNPRAHLHWRFFDVMVGQDGRYLSEDYAFCERWRNVGGRIYADTQSKLNHMGQHLFKGDLLTHLSRHQAVVEAA